MSYSPSILLNWSLFLGLMMLMISSILVMIRFLKGPDIPHRIIAFDLLAIILMGVIILYSILVSRDVFLDVAIIMALIAFLGTVAYAKYLEKGSLK